MRYFKDYLESLKKNFSAVHRKFICQFEDYGGWSEVLKSPYFLVSIMISLLCFMSGFSNQKSPAEITREVVPSLLGLTVASLGILTAVYGGILERRSNYDFTSYFAGVLTTFVHIVIVQVVALAMAVISDYLKFFVFSYIQLTLMIYSILLILPLAFSLKLLGTLIVHASNTTDSKEDVMKERS